MKCYISATVIVRITGTLRYIPKAFAFPKTTTEDYLQQAIGDIIEITKYPLKTLPFFSYGDAKIMINHIAHILQRSTSQTRLQILPLPPMLPQTKSENLQLQNIPSILVPAPRVEPFYQYLRVKTHQLATKLPPIEFLPQPPALIHTQINELKKLQNI